MLCKSTNDPFWCRKKYVYGMKMCSFLVLNTKRNWKGGFQVSSSGVEQEGAGVKRASHY